MRLGLSYGTSFVHGKPDAWEFALLPTMTIRKTTDVEDVLLPTMTIRKTTDVEDVLTIHVTYHLRLIWLCFLYSITFTITKDWI